MTNLHTLQTDEQKTELVDLCKECYEYTHQDNPPNALSKQWEGLVFAEDVFLNGSFYVVKDNRIVAFSLLHSSQCSDTLELGWRGVVPTEVQHEKVLINALSVAQLKYAISEGYQYLQAECDTTDKWSIYLMDHFPFEPAPTWITFQKRNNVN
jgi:hypothetical protein